MTDNERKLQWARANKEKTRAARKQWRDAHPGYDRKWRKRNPDKANAANKRWREKHPEKMRALRNQPVPTRPESKWCECCGRTFESTPHLDHCHLTGIFRGWLCSNCNTGIGLIGDDVASAEKVVAYLKRSYADA